MPTKKLIIAGTVLLLVALMIWANVADSPSESISGGSAGTPVGLEKDLPSEEKIPTHYIIKKHLLLTTTQPWCIDLSVSGNSFHWLHTVWMAK